MADLIDCLSRSRYFQSTCPGVATEKSSLIATLMAVGTKWEHWVKKHIKSSTIIRKLSEDDYIIIGNLE